MNYTDREISLAAERALFEAEMRANHPLFPLEWIDGRMKQYRSPGTQHMWHGWLMGRNALRLAHGEPK